MSKYRVWCDFDEEIEAENDIDAELKASDAIRASDYLRSELIEEDGGQEGSGDD